MEARHLWLTPVTQVTWKAKIGRIMVQQSVRDTTSPKKPEQPWIGGVALAVNHLLCKGKALNSNPTSTIKKEAVSELMTPLWSVIVCAPSFAAAVISNETMTTQVFW
jgi:hypothetical protein